MTIPANRTKGCGIKLFISHKKANFSRIKRFQFLRITAWQFTETSDVCQRVC